VAVAKRVVFLVTGEHADNLQQDLPTEIQPVTGSEGA
jgi:phosphate transport system protein